ncbi:MAG: hypothetical protein J5I41_00925 [Saprospiraceae bacterium]|nr:hypothetical protein [Saprospiraceae bacterium]
MQNTKVFSILQYFSKYELNSLRKFVQSPYFNVNEDLMRLYDLYLALLEKPDPVLDREEAWRTIVGDGRAYDDVRYRKYNSDLLKLVEAYLAQKVYEENPIREANHLIEAVSRRKMIKLYNTVMSSARRLSDRQLYKSAQYYYYQYQIEKNYYEILIHGQKRLDKTNVEYIVENLDRFYLAEKLRYYCSVLTTKYIHSHEYKLLFLEEIVSHVELYDYTNVPAISIFYQIYLTITRTEDRSYFDTLIQLIHDHIGLFPKDEALEIYTYALNYCIRNINQGKKEWLQEYVDLYEQMLKNEIIEFGDEEYGPWHFKNIVTAASRLDRFAWVERFINKYYQQLPQAYRDNALSFNLAQLNFHKKNYGEVISLLHRVEYEDFTYNLNSKVYLMLSYYELDEIEPLLSLMDSFRIYLQRNTKIPANRKRNYGNLIKFLKKLTRIYPGDKAALERLSKEMDEHEGAIVNAPWLREKIAELM